MKELKEFKVTDEIIEIFSTNKVTTSNIKKFIPDYLDYRKEYCENCNDVLYCELSYELNEFLLESNKMTPRDYLNKIENIFKNHDILGSSEIYNFDGTNVEYTGFEIYSTRYHSWIETENTLLDRLATEIRDAKKLKKESFKTLEIDLESLRRIANNPELMEKLNNLKEIK